MSFHGRTRELKVLEAAWGAERGAFIPVYGRRRVGKSELIVHFLNDKPGIYFVGKRATGPVQIQEFLELAARALEEPLLARTTVTTWKEALELVVGRWKGTGKFIIALDEFQWMAEACPELPVVLQELWDRQWSRQGRVMLILCGSYLGFMEREVLGEKSPLFGRRTAQILLRPFGFQEAAEFHPGYSRLEQARAYFVCGGVPAYLLTFDPQKSVEQNIASAILDDNAPLAREPEFLLREELRDLAPYHGILTALAQRAAAPGVLAKGSGIDSRAMSYYLTTLSELGYVQRRHPLSDPPANMRSVRYVLDDPLLRFWFRFVFPHQSLLRLLGPGRGFQECVKPTLEAYFGQCFERMCREALPLLYAQEGVRTTFKIGEYWSKETQVDVVGLREDQWTDLGECKWSSDSSLTAWQASLEDKVPRYPNRRNATIQRRLFVRSLKGKIKPHPQVRLHTLDDLYEASAK